MYVRCVCARVHVRVAVWVCTYVMYVRACVHSSMYVRLCSTFHVRALYVYIGSNVNSETLVQYVHIIRALYVLSDDSLCT